MANRGGAPPLRLSAFPRAPSLSAWAMNARWQGQLPRFASRAASRNTCASGLRHTSAFFNSTVWRNPAALGSGRMRAAVSVRSEPARAGRRLTSLAGGTIFGKRMPAICQRCVMSAHEFGVSACPSNKIHHRSATMHFSASPDLRFAIEINQQIAAKNHVVGFAHHANSCEQFPC